MKTRSAPPQEDVPYPFATAAEMLAMARASKCSIAEMKRANEETRMGREALDEGLDRVWAGGDLGGWFDASRCADETHSKPHPAMVEELLTELAVPASRALVVGDTSFDLDMARAAGVDRVGVGYGAHPVERLWASAPLAVIDALPELLPLIGVPTLKQSKETV